MATRPPPMFLRSYLKAAPDVESTEQSIAGAAIFISYIILALVLTGAIVLNLFNNYAAFRQKTQMSTKTNAALLLRCMLALVSFSTLSYHMLFFLINSYGDWSVQQGIDLSQLDFHSPIALWKGLHLWRWAQIPLFTAFANSVFSVKAADTAILLALTWEMVLAVWMTAIARKSKIQNVWMYVLLAQILPISFVQNLFELARFLSELESDPAVVTKVEKASGESSLPEARDKNDNWRGIINFAFNLALVSLYGRLIGTLPALKYTNLLIPGVLLTRILLVLPYIGGRLFPSIYYASTGVAGLFTLFNVLSQALPSLGDDRMRPRPLFGSISGVPVIFSLAAFADSYTALETNHAVAALGWDVAIGIASWILCTIS